MALWQVEIIIVPKDKINYKNNIEEIDIPSLWSGYQIKEIQLMKWRKSLKEAKAGVKI